MSFIVWGDSPARFSVLGDFGCALGVKGSVLLTCSGDPIGMISKAIHVRSAAAMAVLSAMIPVIIAGIENGMIAVSYMLIMDCAIPGVMLQVLPYVMPYALTVARVVLWGDDVSGMNFDGVPYERGGGVAAYIIRSMVAALVVFWSDGINGVSCRAIPYERGDGVAACACVIRLRCHAGVCSIERELGRAFKIHTCTLDIIYHIGS